MSTAILSRAFLRGHSRPGELDLSKLPDQHRCEWIAYDIAWRTAFGKSPVSPIDPHGKWRDDNLVRIASAWWRRKLRMPPEDATATGPKPADDVVRPNWRKLRPSEMTEAERRLARELRDETLRRLRAESPRAAAMMERIAGDHFSVPMAEEILPP